MTETSRSRLPLEGRLALISGGNTGIGRAVALAFAENGADIAIAWFNNEAQMQSLGEEVRALRRRYIHHRRPGCRGRYFG